VLVLSHSCELDKSGRKELVTVAPVRSSSALQAQQREAIMNRRRYAFLPLPGIPVLGDSYADLREIASVDRTAVLTGVRLASATDSGRLMMMDHLITFFTRTSAPGIGPPTQ